MLNKTSVYARGFDHPECVAVHPDGSIWAGGEGGQIYRITNNGKNIEELISTNGFILGIAFSPGAGWLAICDMGNQCMWKLTLADMKLHLLADEVPGHKFIIPNYAAFDTKGSLYVSDSVESKKLKGKIVKFDKNGSGQLWTNHLFYFANGIALGKGEKFLYVVSSFLPGIERVVIHPDGSAGEREVFCTLPKTVPDGICFDDDENLYVACYTPNTIFKVTPNREVTELVHDWDSHTLCNPTNVAFGGQNFDQLYSANLGGWHISKIDMGVKGLKLVSHL